MGENEKAINEYTKVITEGVNHDYVMALVERGYNYRQMNQVAMALLSFQQAFFLDPHEIQNLCNLAICYSALGAHHMAYEFVLQGLYEVELQNNHQWENDLMQVLAAVYDKAIDKPVVGPDNVKEYIQNRLTNKNTRW
jgi:tetratricopeptide (TPR) repeat protein